MASTLKDYALYIYGGDWPYMAIRNTFPQVNVINILSASFTNNRLGGCGNATFVLSSKNHEYLAGRDLRPDYRVAFRMQCKDEPDAKLRYSGRITQAEMGYGTEKGTRTIKCEGRMTLTRGIPVIVIASNISVQAAAIKLMSFLCNRTIGIQCGETDLITAGSAVMIPMLDGLDTPGDRLLKMLARLAGPDVAYGYTVGKGSGFYAIGQAMNRMYLAEMDETVVDPGFTVGVNLTQAEGKEFREGLYNGALVRCQASLGGGQLTMFYPPPSSGDGMKPWRIANLNVPEVVEPSIGWDYATAWVGAHSFRDGEYNQSVKFHAADFGRQIWPNEIIKNKLRVYMQEPDDDHPEGRVPIDSVVNSYTVKIGGDGSVSTDFQLGTPPINLGQEWKKVYQEVQLAEIREFWSTAEMAAGDSDVMRTWRRAAARQWWIRNFWGANLDSLESCLSPDDWEDAGLPGSNANGQYDWVYDGDIQAVVSALDTGTAMVGSVRIPTGRLTTGAVVYAKGTTREVKPSGSGNWHYVGDGNYAWIVTSNEAYPQPDRSVSNYWARLWLLAEHGDDVTESPVTIEISRPRRNVGGAEGTLDAQGMIDSPEWTDVAFALDQTHLRYYGVRLIRPANMDHCYVLPGWWEETSDGSHVRHFHQNYFTAPHPANSFYVGQDDHDPHLQEHAYFRIEAELPSADNNWGHWLVRIYRRDTDELVCSTGGNIHPFGAYLEAPWSPAGNYWGGMQWYMYPKTSASFHTVFRPHGLRKITATDAGVLNVAATRDDQYWTHGTTGTLLTLHGADTNSSGDYGVRVLCYVELEQALQAWGLAFHLEDDEWPDP